MKNCFIFLLLLSPKINAQPYKPLLDSANIWCFTGNVPPVNIPDTFYNGSCNYHSLDLYAHTVFSNHDTIIDSMSYKVLESVNIQSGFCRYGYIREDTMARRVYFRDNMFNPEMLLFDFSMQPGDMILLTFSTPAGFNPFYPDAIYMLDSITNLSVAGGITRAFYLSCAGCPNVLEWVEGIGNKGSLAYRYTANLSGIVFGSCSFSNHDWQYNYHQILTSFEHNYKQYFDTCAYHYMLANPNDFDHIDSCIYDYIGSGIDEYLSNGVHLFPNPSESIITIDSKKISGQAKFEVVNPLGDKLFSEIIFLSKDHPFNIDVSPLKPGLYIARIYGNGYSISKKIIRSGAKL